MGCSRPEYWSGLPCPRPGGLPDPGIKPCLLCLLCWQAGSLPLAPPEKLMNVKVTQSCPPRTIQSMEFSRPEYWGGRPFPSPGDLLNPGIEPRSPALHADSLPAEPQGKPKNTGVGSLSLLQGIFPTQGSNWDLLPCRRILYQLSYEGAR